mgnify:CR=1 FL=1
MGKWFGQASEIEELRTENRRLKEQVATLEARLRAAYADAGITALADPSSPTASTDSLAPATASSLEVSDAEMELLATGPKIAAVKAYKDRTGVSLKAAKAAIDTVPVPVPTSAIVSTSRELTDAELQMVADDRLISAIKAYKDRTGVDLKTAKAAIDAAR